METFNINELYAKISELFGYPLMWEKPTFEEDGIYIESKDISHKAGILADAFESLTIKTYMTDFEEAKEYGLVAGMTLSFHYDLKRGAYSDIIFAVCHLDKDGHWSVRKVWEER